MKYRFETKNYEQMHQVLKTIKSSYSKSLLMDSHNFYYHTDRAKRGDPMPYDEDPPILMYKDNTLLAVGYQKSSIRDPSLLLFDTLVSIEKGHGYGSILYTEMLKRFFKKAPRDKPKSIRLSSSHTAVEFWASKGFVFSGYSGKYGYLLINNPLFKTVKQQLLWREEFLSNSPSISGLNLDTLTKSRVYQTSDRYMTKDPQAIKNAIESIRKVKPYYLKPTIRRIKGE